MRYFLDTNICIYALKNKFPRIKEMLKTLSPSDIAIPSMVKAELYYGALKSEKKSKVISALEKFLSPFEIIPFGDKEIMPYARMTTLSHGATLVTHNKNEFERVEDLVVEDWSE